MILMRVVFKSLVVAALLLPGCGPSAGEQAAQSPEVRQRLLEIQKQREAEAERLKKELHDVQTSTEAALRAAERLRQATESANQKSQADVAPETSTQRPRPENPAAEHPPAKANVESAPKSAAPVPAAASKDRVSSTGAAKNLAAWGQLRAGLSTADVTKLLGSPTTTSEDRTLLYWHYGAGPGSGRIAFLHSGQLVAWESPAR